MKNAPMSQEVIAHAVTKILDEREAAGLPRVLEDAVVIAKVAQILRAPGGGE